MRTSDARYRAVQRTKRDPFDYVPLVKALRDARLDPHNLNGLDAVVKRSAGEFTHVLLATGMTANDFRRNFRVGSNGANLIPVNSMAGHDALTAQKLDGYVVMRLSREQTKNVKLRWAKLRDQDRLLHDPQGSVWMGLLTCWINATSETETIARLNDLRDKGERLTAKADVVGQDAVDRSARELLRYIASPVYWATVDWDDKKIEEEARSSARYARRIYREGCEWHGGVVDTWRKKIEEQLVVAEAFIAGDDVKAASFNPDTSKRHSTEAQLVARLDRVLEGLGKI